MPKIKVLVSHCIGGGVDVKEGDVLEVSDHEARRKIHMGFAVALEELPAERGEVRLDEGTIETADPKLKGRK